MTYVAGRAHHKYRGLTDYERDGMQAFAASMVPEPVLVDLCLAVIKWLHGRVDEDEQRRTYLIRGRLDATRAAENKAAQLASHARASMERPAGLDESHWSDAHGPLSTRAKICLRRFKTRTDFLVSWPAGVAREPNVGRKTIVEIQDVLGLPKLRRKLPENPTLAGYTDEQLKLELNIRGNNRVVEREARVTERIRLNKKRIRNALAALAKARGETRR